jgi:glycosyltransferase involved in cell wall biosynthesis
MIGNPDSIHVQRWARHFSQRGFDVSLLSYYQPRVEFRGNPTAHFVRPRPPGPRRAGPRSVAAMGRFPGMLRLITAARLRAGGFYRELDRINPDLVHAHYVSDYGFLAALSGRHPLVVSAWGSDVLVDPERSWITRRIVRWVLAQADLITYNGEVIGDAARALGAPRERILPVVLGVGPEMLDALKTRIVAPADREPMILSLRSLERSLYNVDTVIRAMPEVLRRVPAARLVVGSDGALRGDLETLVRSLDVAGSVEFAGTAAWPDGMAEWLGRAAVYVSVPSSDATSVTTLEAMAAGAYPVVSDIPANRELVGAEGGTVVPVRQVGPLAEAVVSALEEPGRRSSAAIYNRERVNQFGLWDVNMARLEKAYRNLASGGKRVTEEVH